ncbi:MAG: exodeoxyribonuclease VII small subunit [Candidatus Accumulibacter sp.]|nr:exodeoxyribonuclease VII small subunit [Accumulibacter sp.]
MVRSHTEERGAEDSEASPVSPDTPFEMALAELERIVQDMEGGSLPLEESISAYRRGSELLRHCQGQLAQAERRIRIFENGESRDAGLDAGAGQ